MVGPLSIDLFTHLKLNIMTNTLKINKLTKEHYHQFVSPAFCAYRRKMHDEIGIGAAAYSRLFTEKRTYGVRTKYWLSMESLPVKEIEAYVVKNPTFVANGVTYRVSTRVMNFTSWWGSHTSFILECKNV